MGTLSYTSPADRSDGATLRLPPARRPRPLASGSLPVGVASIVRPHAAAMVDTLVNRIQGTVRAYAGPRGGRRRRLIESAVGASVQHFVDALDGRRDGLAQVDELFRRMGRAEALDGNSREAMHEALEVATRDAWRALHSISVDSGLSTAALGQLGDALFELMEHLHEQVSLGYHAASAELGHASQQARARLVDALLEARPADEVDGLAAAARWRVPARAVLVVGEARPGVPADPVLVDDDLLVRVGTPHTVVLVPCRDITEAAPGPSPDVVEELRDVLALDRVALGWPVPVEELPDALRWGRRALDLVEQGVVEDAEVLSCAELATTLWLHSEPRLRRQVSRDVLAPVLAETPHNRAVLCQTLLAWLSTHDSAPTLARRLGVHPQTVRYRLRRLHALLGDRLEDPQAVLAMRLALEASLPIWPAGRVDPSA